MLNANLVSFLTLGYFLNYQAPRIHVDITRIDKARYANASTCELVEVGAELWRQAITAYFEPHQSHVVPISGGLDSRAILAALLEHTAAHRIQTFTFGTPGTLDYEIGCEIAKKLGTRHTKFDLTQYSYTQAELEDISRRIDHQSILFHHWPVSVVDRLFSGSTIWSGFLGDPLSGSHRPVTPTSDLKVAISYFIDRNRYVKSCRLVSEKTDLSALLNLPIIDQSFLTLEEQLDLRNRQMKYIAPHVLMKGYQWCTPFCFQPWVDFILSIPDTYRTKQCLYKKILLQAFPGPFAYRTKSTGGLPLDASRYRVFTKHMSQKFRGMVGMQSRSLNYLNFDWAIRNRTDVFDLIQSNLTDLKARNIVELGDLYCIFTKHMNKKGNYADALLVLVSLEIHLKAGMSVRRIC